jgi:hypothetical protein
VEDRPLSVRARKKVKAQVEKAERERLMFLFQKRMELARSGAIFFREGKVKDAVQNYYSYLEILEKTKKVPRGGLEPRLFDQQKDIAELLLLSGVYWDLSKLHDRVKIQDKTKLVFYLDRFVMFSKGLPFQHISSELIRKYLVNSLPKNRKEFKDAHIQLGGGQCFIATAVEDYCEPETLPALRKFRDEVLLKNFAGRGFVKVYYKLGPNCARIVLRTPEKFQRALARVFNTISEKLSA